MIGGWQPNEQGESPSTEKSKRQIIHNSAPMVIPSASDTPSSPYQPRRYRRRDHPQMMSDQMTARRLGQTQLMTRKSSSLTPAQLRTWQDITTHSDRSPTEPKRGLVSWRVLGTPATNEGLATAPVQHDNSKEDVGTPLVTAVQSGAFTTAPDAPSSIPAADSGTKELGHIFKCQDSKASARRNDPIDSGRKQDR